MNIFDTLIDERQIIGITAIHPTENEHEKLISYSFTIYTASNKINFYSPEFDLNKQEKNADAWLKKYMQVRSAVAQQIGDLSVQ